MRTAAARNLLGIVLLVTGLTSCAAGNAAVIASSTGPGLSPQRQRPADAPLPEVLGSTQIEGRRWSLSAFRDEHGGFCVRVDAPDIEGTPVCDIEVPPGHPLNAAVEVTREDLAFIYGRADPGVRDLYAVDSAGRHPRRIYEDRSHEGRWFFIPVRDHEIRDVIGVLANGEQHSLAPELSLFLKRKAPPLKEKAPEL